MPRSKSSAVDVAATTDRHQSLRLLVVLVLIGAFFVVELIGAKIARSDVLEADAYHLLMDVLALGISLLAMRAASRGPSARFTFGLRRAEPLAALANGALVLGTALELVRDAIEHLGRQTAPRSGLMLAIASAALVVNGLSAWLLHGAMAGRHAHGHHHDHDGDRHDHDHRHDDPRGRGYHLNLHGAWLHLLGDALGALAAFGAGLAIRFGAPPIVDPVASLAVVAILLVGGLRLLRDAGLVLLEAAPRHLPLAKVERVLQSLEGVTHVSAVHIWSLGTGHDAITARVRTSSTDPRLGSRVGELLRQRLTVEYVTVQVEVE